MNFSFREKGLIASLVITLLVFGNYFFQVFANLQVTPSEQNGFGDLIGLVILVVILEAIIHAFLASQHSTEIEDERDKLIQRMSYRNSYWFLIIGIWVLLIQFLATGSGVWFDFNYLAIFTSAYGLAYLLLLLFVLAEVINFITQLYYYRKGI